MRVLSLWQPFASLCVYGLKPVETRDRPTLIRGRIGLLATATEPKAYQSIEYQDYFEKAFEQMLGTKSRERTRLAIDYLPRGSIVGTVDLYDCLPSERFRVGDKMSASEYAFGDFSPGRWGWMFRDPVRFKTPIPAKGGQVWKNFDLHPCQTCGQIAEPGIASCCLFPETE